MYHQAVITDQRTCLHMGNLDYSNFANYAYIVLAGHSSIGEKTADVLNESTIPQCQTPFSIINDDLPDGTTSHALLLIR